jgi:tRNA_anti-like
MVPVTTKISSSQWLHLVFGVAIILAFFLPWVTWDGAVIKGTALATGDFFKTSESKFGLANPFPRLGFLFYSFWLIPVLAAISVVLVLLKKKTIPFSFIAGAMSLALITVFILFTNTLIDLGVGNNVFRMLNPAAYIHAACAIGLVITAFPVKRRFPKVFWLLIGPVLAYGSYKYGEKYVMGETHTTTEQVKPDYTVDALALIKEFTANDTAANKKYLDKMLVVNGTISAIEIQADSTSTIKFADSTGSYAIFSVEKNQLNQAKNSRTGDPVSLKGVCSGSIFSEILGTTSISFKRAIINKNK